MGLVTYIKESYEELKNKVSWPSWSDLQSSAIVVAVPTPGPITVPAVVTGTGTGFLT